MDTVFIPRFWVFIRYICICTNVEMKYTTDTIDVTRHASVVLVMNHVLSLCDPPMPRRLEARDSR